MKIAILISFLSLSLFAVEIEGNPALTFTGYKFTEKTGVSGTFKEITWKLGKGKNLSEALVKSSLKIDALSIDAGNELRNKNISEGLFKNWGGRNIDVKFTEVNEKLNFVKSKITIGKKTHDVVFQYHQVENKVIFTGVIDLLQMGFVSAFSALAKNCESLHKGTDGVVKTWSTVDLKVEANLKAETK